uniref:Uncharacterized protein n=1 Tax=Plectus sambesii TaxID=2011161 RepID=A0A914WBK1_9BILA
MSRNGEDIDVVPSAEASEVAAVLDNMIESRLKLVSRNSTAITESFVSEQEDTGIRLFKLSRRLLKADEDNQIVGKATGEKNGAARKPFVRKRKRQNSSDDSSDDGDAKLRASVVTSDWVMKSAGFSTVIK